MARQIQIRRGTAEEHENFTGAIGEITMDITYKTLRVHDGETVGGTMLAKQSEVLNIDDIIYAMAPDYSRSENLSNILTTGSMYTFSKTGYLRLRTYNNSGWWFKFNNQQGETFIDIDGENFVGLDNYYFIPMGTTIYVQEKHAGGSVTEAFFYPCIGSAEGR